METWELDFNWLKLRHVIKEQLGIQGLPDMNSILLLIGIQELGLIREEWTKEEKQDLMHIAVCELLGTQGYYEFEGRDQDGWPHYRKVKSVILQGVDEQESLLKHAALTYFEGLLTQTEEQK